MNDVIKQSMIANVIKCNYDESFETILNKLKTLRHSLSILLDLLLKKGYNEIVIRVKSSLRNLMGPHHNKYHFERRHVSPDIFTLYKTWKDGVSDGYTSDYSLVPFGIDEIEILK